MVSLYAAMAAKEMKTVAVLFNRSSVCVQQSSVAVEVVTLEADSDQTPFQLGSRFSANAVAPSIPS